MSCVDDDDNTVYNVILRFSTHAKPHENRGASQDCHMFVAYSVASCDAFRQIGAGVGVKIE